MKRARKTGSLAQRVPGGQDRDAHEDAHGAQLEPGQQGDPLVEDLPWAEAQARPGHQRDPDAEQHQPREEAGKPGEDDGG